MTTQTRTVPRWSIGGHQLTVLEITSDIGQPVAVLREQCPDLYEAWAVWLDAPERSSEEKDAWNLVQAEATYYLQSNVDVDAVAESIAERQVTD